ncbi:GerAB/ArcD/ProY family transporter [Cohnella hongkongensis]|uniref:Endospore germination permease n=1 Tax=Cohnella hongkongensis TaxID=178337 RepID=A0ABV9F5W7_9BACL
MRKPFISELQFFFMIFVSIASLTFLSVPSQLIPKVNQDLWLSMCLGITIDVFVAFLLYRLGLRYPGQSIVQYSRSILGPAGHLISLLLLLFFLGVCITTIWIYSDFLSSSLLPDSPLVSFSGTLTLCSGWAAFKGIETIARLSQILGTIILLSTLILFASSIPIFEASHLLPQFEHGAWPAVRGAAYPASWFGVCIMMGMLMPHLSRPERTLPIKAYAVLLGAFIMTGYMMYSIAVLGANMASQMKNPIFVYTRVAQFLIFERIEVLAVLVFVCGSFITYATLYYCIAQGCRQLFGTKSYKPWIYAFAPLLVVLPVLDVMQRFGQWQPFLDFWFPVVALSVEGGITALLFVGSFFRKTKR